MLCVDRALQGGYIGGGEQMCRPSAASQSERTASTDWYFLKS